LEDVENFLGKCRQERRGKLLYSSSGTLSIRFSCAWEKYICSANNRKRRKVVLKSAERWQSYAAKRTGKAGQVVFVLQF
jgi:hypothetical protein